MIEYINFDMAGDEYLLRQLQGYNVTKALINQELSGIFGSSTLRDLNDILKMYKVYEEGCKFDVDISSDDWLPSEWKSKQIKTLIDKEARFMFSVSPDIILRDIESTEPNSARIEANEKLVQAVLKENNFKSKLVRGAKDCLIGKRLALAVNVNEESGITIAFIPSMEFIYETDPTNVDRITKFIQFYNTVINDDKAQQRIYKKKWYMENGFCRVVEELYDGSANLVETITPDTATRFSFIPVYVIVNDGLTGDPFGISEVESLIDDESFYNKLSSKDIDSLRKGTDQISYTIDADPRTTKDLSRAPGAFWDIATDVTKEGKTAQVGTLDNPMSYSGALSTTLRRIKNDMYAQLDMPDTTSEALQGIVTSGKTMQAIYWGLITRCNEKMLDWIPAFEHAVESILEAGRLYPEIVRRYIDDPIVDGYMIQVESNYPILQDETEEKATDILEVNAKTLSRKAYIKKWRGLTDDEIQAELEQIVLETSMLEHESYPSEVQLEEPEENEDESEEPPKEK